MTVSELTQKFPSIPWMEYFSTLLPKSITVSENEMVIVNVPSFISELEKLLEQTPKRIQANYVMWRAAATSVSYLNDEIRKRQLAYSTVISGEFYPIDFVTDNWSGLLSTRILSTDLVDTGVLRLKI